MIHGAPWLQLAALALGALIAGCSDPEPERPAAERGVVRAEPTSRPAETRASEEPADQPAHPTGDPSIFVDVARQRLVLFVGETAVREYPISTSKVGTGSEENSGRTPLGRHRISEKLGDDAPLGTIFRSRENTGEVAAIITDSTDLEEDLVLTRILWLEGMEAGVNQGPGIDSKERYIYIHGTNEEGLIGTPASHGCVRMRNADVIDLYDRVPVGTEVWILESED